MAGERGKVGDHGQDGKQGIQGLQGIPGTAGKDVLTKKQTLALFLFVVAAFGVLAWRAEANTSNISEQNERVQQFVDETCRMHPDFAPATCGSQEGN